MAGKKEIVEVKPMEICTAKIRIEGITPLIEHAFSEKAKREMLEKQMGTKSKSKKKEPRNPVEDFIRSMYWITPMPTEFTEEAFNEAINNGAKFGFPATGVKQAAIQGAYRKHWIPSMKEVMGDVFIVPDAIAHDGTQVFEIFSDPPLMREDMVTIMGTKDLRYRGEFRNWYAYITIQFDKNGEYSLNDIVNYINAGGFTCGLGDWRVEKKGQSGMYKVSSTDSIQ